MQIHFTHFITNFNNAQNNYSNKNCFYNSNMCCASHKMLFVWPKNVHSTENAYRVYSRITLS